MMTRLLLGWGENIYEYLEKSGQYTSYLALVKDLGYEETLRRTGSKTRFLLPMRLLPIISVKMECMAAGRFRT